MSATYKIKVNIPSTTKSTKIFLFIYLSPLFSCTRAEFTFSEVPFIFPFCIDLFDFIVVYFKHRIQGPFYLPVYYRIILMVMIWPGIIEMCLLSIRHPLGARLIRIHLHYFFNYLYLSFVFGIIYTRYSFLFEYSFIWLYGKLGIILYNRHISMDWPILYP